MIAPLTNIAVPAAELTGKPRTGANCSVCIELFELAPTPTENKPKTPQPNKNVPMASLNFTRTPTAQKRPEHTFTEFPDRPLRRNHYGRQVIPDPYQGLSVLCLFLGEHRGLMKI